MTQLLQPLPGAGLLARYGELVLLCDADPSDDAQLRALLAAVSEVAAAGGDGRRLGRRLAGLLSAARASPRYDESVVDGVLPAGVLCSCRRLEYVTRPRQYGGVTWLSQQGSRV